MPRWSTARWGCVRAQARRSRQAWSQLDALTQVTDPKGGGDTLRAMERDALGRVTKIEYEPGYTSSFSYPDGQVVLHEDRSGSTQYWRDILGRVASKLQIVNDNPSNPSRYLVAYRYDGGSLSIVLYPSGLNVFYRRDKGRRSRATPTWTACSKRTTSHCRSARC